ncbi:MAG: OmpA family protein [Pseudomonadota bacterium]
MTALMPQMAADRGVTRPNQNANAVALQASGQPVAKLQVGFEGESHLLTVDGMKTLRTLAAALEDPRLQNSKFQILAYAYTPNAPASAQPVSARRAQTVLEHLQGFYGMGTDKFLGVQGMGASALNSGNAADPMNQRIEIVNIGNL